MVVMRIRTWVGFGLGAAVLAIVALAIARPRGVGSYTLACGSATLRLRGRLVEEASGGPCAGAWILTLPQRTWADEPETIANYRKWNAEEAENEARAQADGRELLRSKRPSLCASGTADATGTFDLLVSVPWSMRTVNGVPLDHASPPPRRGVQALLVEREGHEPIVLEVTGGTWVKAKVADLDIWATWDLGTLRVGGMR